MCTTEAPGFARPYQKFKELNEVLGVSADYSVITFLSWLIQYSCKHSPKSVIEEGMISKIENTAK